MKSNNWIKNFNKTFSNEFIHSELHEFISNIKSKKLPENTDLWSERFLELSRYLQSINKFSQQFDTMMELSNRSLEAVSKESQESEERLRELNRILNGVVSSLEEGFLVINRDGRCGEFISQKAKTILKKSPDGNHLADIIELPTESRDSFVDWLNMIFLEVLPFEELAKLAPSSFKIKNSEKRITFKFKPIRSKEDGKITEIIMIIDDPAEENSVAKELGEQKLFTDMVIKYLNNKPEVIKVIQRTRETSDSLKSWTFSGNIEFQKQAINLANELNSLKKDLNECCMYSLGYKLHQAEDEIITFFDVSSNSQDGENLIHLIGQEIFEALTEFLNKYRHIFVFDNNTTLTKEIPIESIYKFCAELLRMGLTDLLKYYVDEIVAVPLVSLFAPIEARIYSQSLTQDRQIDCNIIDTRNIRVIPEFYSLLLQEIIPVINTASKPVGNPEFKINQTNIYLELISSNNNDTPLLNIKVEFDKKFKFALKEESDISLGIINLKQLESVISDMGGSINWNSQDSKFEHFIQFNVPYVSELNSDIMDWINTKGSAIGNPNRQAG